MYPVLLTIHSIFRWFVLFSLIASIIRAYVGLTKSATFSNNDNAWRHWTATISHLQLTIGIVLYFKSPIVDYFWHTNQSPDSNEHSFFGLIHIIMMITSVVILTIGSGLARRRTTDKEKFRTILVWFSVSLLIILISIPWPFSPLASRPYLRTF